MSKYDNLDARKELEQRICQDIKIAFKKRGFEVRHNGTGETHAPAGLPDIEVWNDKYHLTFEVTKSKGAQQDRELNSIRDHLNTVKNQNPSKECYCVFVSPETSQRMLDGIKDHNRQRDAEGKKDLKILPLSFSTLEMYLTKLSGSHADLYPVKNFIEVFGHYNEFVDDLRIKKLLVEKVFPSEHDLSEEVEKEEVERDQKTLEKLIKDLAKIEDYMRENGIATGHSAIDTLIYLVFMKLYEEKREQNGYENRLSSAVAFDKYLQNLSTRTRNQKKGIHELFKAIRDEGEFINSGMFTRDDKLPETVTDDFIKNHIISVLGEYRFIGTKIDALGAVYEVLALRAEKDVKVGQFFTPENIVKFMVKLAGLDIHDYVLDPACGTGRFLIFGMHDMVEKAKKNTSLRNKQEKIEQIRKHQLFGADIDVRIAKIAKMNMWIHGDGKSNIFGGKDYNGLTLHKHGFNGHDTFDKAFDVVMTNPPLGELNYQTLGLKKNVKLQRFPFLPHKNETEEKLNEIRARIEKYERELSELENEKTQLEENDVVKEFLNIPEEPTDKELKRKKKEFKNNEEIKKYLKLLGQIKRKQKTINENKEKERNLEAKISSRNVEYEITGNTMKGGALFLSAIWHYLKDNAYPDNHPEWRGGKVLTILDEGILNTDDYKEVRKFIREHFYIKAIISLTRDTFAPISKTSTKTSILYAVKKTDPHAKQQEPIFYAHVEKVGMDTKGKVIENHLDRILERYLRFKNTVLESCNTRGEFDRKKFVRIYGDENAESGE